MVSQQQTQDDEGREPLTTRERTIIQLLTHALIPPTPDHTQPLTTRELQVLQLLVDGRTNAEIGRELYIATSTARNHVAELLAKTNCNTRTQLAAHAVRAGLAQ